MTPQTVKNTSDGGVNSAPMDDDETRGGETAMGAVDYDAYTSVAPNVTPTEMAELAWSAGCVDDLPAWADQPTAKYRRSRSAMRWGVALTAVMTAGTAALWFGSVFYHNERSTPPAAKPPVAQPTVAETLPPAATPVPPPTTSRGGSAPRTEIPLGVNCRFTACDSGRWAISRFRLRIYRASRSHLR